MRAHPRIEVGIDCADPERLAPFWATALGYEIGDLDGDGVYLDLLPPDDSHPVVYLQRVPEEKTTKNRVHLDLLVDDPQALIGRLLGMGARPLGAPKSGAEGGWWQVMADPDGNEFCVVRDG